MSTPASTPTTPGDHPEITTAATPTAAAPATRNASLPGRRFCARLSRDPADRQRRDHPAVRLLEGNPTRRVLDGLPILRLLDGHPASRNRSRSA